MKNPGVNLLLALTVLFVGLTVGFSLGRNSGHQPVQVSVIQKSDISSAAKDTLPLPSAAASTSPDTATQPSTAAAGETVHNTVPASQETNPPSSGPVNVNTADLDALMTLPGIGEVLAQRIIDYRQNYGPFQYPEELTNVSGIGEKRLDAIWDYITVGG